MTQYVKSTSFASKDALPAGNPLKIVKGTEIDTEFNNIVVAVGTKADLLNPVFTGIPTAATAAVNTSNSQLATTAFVVAQVAGYAPTKTGANATGTWNISITGNAATATNATNATTAANGGVTSVNGSTGAVTITSVGTGQSWQDVSGSRAIGVTYTNSTGRVIAVAVNTSSGATTTLSVGGVVVGRYGQDTGGLGSQLFAIVPNGASYVASGGSINTWAELR